jgi:hypothetical protein
VAEVDVVAGGDDEPHAARVDRCELLVVDDPTFAVGRVAAPEGEATPGDQRRVVTETG